MSPDKLAAARQRLQDDLAEPTRKGWHKSTLVDMGVGLNGDGRFVFPMLDAAGEPCGAVLYSDEPGAKPKARAESGTTRELWPRPEDTDGPTLYVVEGEPDAVSARELGLPAVALPGAGKVSASWPDRLAHGRERVDLVADSDAVGRARMRSMADKLDRIGVPVYVLDLAPDADDGYDLGDLVRVHGRGVAGRLVGEVAASATRWRAKHEPEPEASSFAEFVATSSAVLTTTLDTVEPTSVRWLWKPYVPLGKVTILAGAPGLGKSQLTALLAANVTRASFFDTDHHEPANAIILSAEDDLADTVVPRLMAANADLRRVEAISVRKTYPEGVTTNGTIKLPGNVGDLARRLARKPDVKLVVFDPVASFFGRDHSTHSNQDVRDLLDPLVALAAHYGVAILLLLHLNKSDAKTWAEKIAESHGFQAVARSVLVLAPDPDADEADEDVARVLAIPKLNLARAATFALRCKIEGAVVTGHKGELIDTARMVLMGRVDTPADDLLIGGEPGDRGARDDAAEFLRAYLADGWRTTAEVKAEAKRCDVSWRTIERVRRSLTKRAKQPGVAHGPWLLALKDATEPVPKVGGVGSLGDLDDSTPPTNTTPPTNGTGNVAFLPFANRPPDWQENGQSDTARERMEHLRGARERDDDDVLE